MGGIINRMQKFWQAAVLKLTYQILNLILLHAATTTPEDPGQIFLRISSSLSLFSSGLIFEGPVKIKYTSMNQNASKKICIKNA